MSTKFALLAIGVSVALVAQLFVAFPAQTQERPCIYEGREYPPGSTLGPYICIDGTWQ